ncbi:Y-family DNA polymerase [Lacibacter sp.]|uniref:Y-family DNA polymerase n=1 Tax=Lacibacter sp. TaxID=1915409 RepID=UPI002B4B16FA|nr:Y-family DNA polymerase [Lacibacter sp.]HLP37751.1 Y-family DNA polymerase [Lacibacter sp.]
MIALVDCNNFYASCERIFQPWLENKPVVVLSNNDGCVIARSEEAKQIGIEMGAPAFMMQELLSKNNVNVFSSNYTLYGNLSERVLRLLGTFTPRIECYSIDEAFLDVSDMFHTDLFTYGSTIRQTIRQHIGIPVTVGIAPTKTLAKMANRYAKKTQRHKGVYCLDTKEKINEVLNFTEIGDVWGIGAQHGRKLKWMGITTAADFVNQLNPDWVRTNMTVVGERMLNELNGIPSIEWEDMIKPKKGICTARSFGKLLSEKKDMQEAVANYASSCAAKLRKQNSCAGLIHVLIQTNVHRTQDKQYARNITLKIPVATNSTSEIIRHALKGLDIIYKPGYNFKKAGVIVMDIVPETEVQQSLFDKTDRKKEAGLMKILDKVNTRFGKDLVRFAIQGYARQWRLKQESLSPCYTTNIDQVLTIKI